MVEEANDITSAYFRYVLVANLGVGEALQTFLGPILRPQLGAVAAEEFFSDRLDGVLGRRRLTPPSA
jgi:hypothetical protein